MAEWIPCGKGFIEADVIRWKEAVWGPRNAKRPGPGKNIRIGDRLVTAEVLGEADEDGWVWLLVRGCEVVFLKEGRKIELLKKGLKTKRQQRTVLRGKPERLPWSDEGARDQIVSRYLGNRKPVSSASRERDTGEN